jgi:prepilin-type N-terminal cleavage/methylation domain-containing protein
MGKLRRESGFSLVEIMVVVAIMAVLTAIGVPAYRIHTMKAKASEAVNHMATIRALQVSHKATNDTYLALPAHPALVPASYQPWGNPGGNWDELGFSLDTRIRYQYRADPGSTGDILTSFSLTAITDFDGLGPPDDTWTMDEDRIIAHINDYK